jgi:tRNA(fMet)-specific endonuclease VapC
VKGYLLDTNHVAKAEQRHAPVYRRIYDERKRGRRVGTCVPVLCEVEAGRLNVRLPEAYRSGLDELMRRIRLWPMTRTTAEHFGELKRDLKRRGRVLSQVDMMLAALCRELDLVRVTTDNDFAALPWLKTENWA